MVDRNLWRSPMVAKAFLYQQKARPYLELLNTTESYIAPSPQERWLDLGCGSGRLIRSIWEKSHGSVNTIVGIDISPTALRYARNSIANLSPKPGPERIQLIQADFGGGLWMPFRSSSFDGVTAGLSISYADHWDPDRQAWSNQSYVKLLKDIFVLLKNGGSFVFSSNVPNPNFRRIASESWREIFFNLETSFGYWC